MAIRWGSGFSRVIAVVGVVYWILSALVIGLMARDAMTTYDIETYTSTLHWDYLWYGLGKTVVAIPWIAGIYVAGMLTVRGARWVARGFVDPA